MSDPVTRKAALRQAALSARAAAHAAGQGEATAHLLAALAPWRGRVLAGYLPMRSEIDPRPAMAAWDGPVCVPVIVAPGQPLRFREWTPGAALVPGPYGTLLPESGGWLVPQAVVVPLVAFDRRGFRLGYGGGFYDRTLEGLRAAAPVTAIGFAFAAQELAEVPVEPTDQPLDLIVTEVGVRIAPYPLSSVQKYPTGRSGGV